MAARAIIEEVEGFHLCRPGAGAGGRDEHVFLLRLVTEDGLAGWGEAHGHPAIAKAVIDAPVLHPAAGGLRALLVGEAAEDIPALVHRLYRGTFWIGRDGVVMQAIAAAELALLDLAGQRARRPVAALFGGKTGAAIPAYASGKVGATPEATAMRLKADEAQGFSAFKIGWPPFGASLAGDLAFLEAARDAIGPKARLMVDAAQAFTPDEALARAHAFAPFGLSWIEEPLDRDDLAGQARLTAQSPVPIAAGEGECSLRGLSALLEGGCVHILQPDLTRCGWSAAQAAAALAAARGINVASHSFTTALNVVAHAHLLATLPNADLLEWPVAPLAVWSELFPDAPAPSHGVLHVPDKPGWGIAPAPAALARFVVR
jgi:L-alanine-DL-glutamate epimerase-like enolase superfamily enzyme